MTDQKLECGCEKPLMGPHVHCPRCGAPPRDPKTGRSNQELRNYDMLWGEGDVYCVCGMYVRSWDRG